jgi:hypothetical protein
MRRWWQGLRRDGTVAGGKARGWFSALLALVTAVGVLASLSGCTRYHGPLTSLGDVEQYPAALWYRDPARSQIGMSNGIYVMPDRHLLLVHVQIPNTNLDSLGPGSVHGAVGVWWVALDSRVPGGGGNLVWMPSCGLFKTTGKGAEYDLAGDYLAGPASANLSRYPVSFNPDDGSVSVALSPQDEITIPRSGSGGPAPYLQPASKTCTGAP